MESFKGYGVREDPYTLELGAIIRLIGSAERNQDQETLDLALVRAAVLTEKSGGKFNLNPVVSTILGLQKIK